MESEEQSDYAIDLDATNAGVVVAAAGELDFVGARYLRERLVEAVKDEPAVVRIDLSGVSFLDSAAVGLLVSTKKRVSNYGGSFSVTCGALPQSRRVLEIMGLIEYLNVDSAE
jgi:anti-sigma B factor antagonist